MLLKFRKMLRSLLSLMMLEMLPLTLLLLKMTPEFTRELERTV
jgi:hypothetical protein